MNKKNKKNYIIIIASSIVVIFAIAIFIIIKLAGNNKLIANETGNVVLDTTEISSKGKYFKYDYDGTTMEFFAVRDANGTVRMAFNRCQVCYDSGRGYFVQEKDEFVCQNCGNRYRTASIGTEKGGCNPSPITTADKIVNGENVEIKERIFFENKYLFN